MPTGRQLVALTLLPAALSSIATGQEVRRAEPASSPAEVRRAEPANPATPVHSGPVEAKAVPLESFSAGADLEPKPVAPRAVPPPTVLPGGNRPQPSSAPATAPAQPAMTPRSTVSSSTAPTAPEPGEAPATAEATQLQFANGLYSRKMYDMAAPEYERYLAMNDYGPDRQVALFRLGECYRALGRKDAAKNCYDQIVTLFGSGDYIGPAAYRLGDIYYQERDYATALPLFRKASVRLKDPAVIASAKFYTARCLDNLELNTQARTVYEEVISISGTNPFRESSRLAVARILSDGGRRQEAIDQYEALAKESSDGNIQAESLVKSGLLRLDLKQAEKAGANFRAALDLPEIGQWKELAELGLIHTLYDTGKYDEVIERYDSLKGRVSAERQPELLIVAANAQRQLGNHKEARAAYEEITKSFPTSPYAAEAEYQGLVSLYNANDPSVVEAADAFLKKVQDPDKKDQVTLLKAESLYKQQQFAAAAPLYSVLSSSVRLPATLRAEALFKLGWCSNQTGDTESAVEHFSGFIRQYPTNKLIPAALAQRATALQQLKRYKEAIADFDFIVRRYPKAKEREFALQQKALVLGQQQDNAGMAETFRQLLKEYPKSPAAAQANYWIGWSAFEAKSYAEAVEPLKNARQLDKEQFFERATLRLMLAHYYLEERDPLAEEVDIYSVGEGQGKVPAEVLRWLGSQFFVAKDYPKAEKYLAQLVARKDDSKPDDLLALAKCELQSNKTTEAIGHATNFIGLSSEPNSKANGYLVLGRAQLAANQLGEAQKSAETACSLQPEGRVNAEGRILVGDVTRARGDYKEAAATYTRVALVFDDANITPQALEKAYDAYTKAGMEPEARKTLNTLQSRYPEYQGSLTKGAKGR